MEESPLKQSDAVLQWIADIQRQREHAETLRQLQAWGVSQCHWALATPTPITPPDHIAAPTGRADVVETVSR